MLYRTPALCLLLALGSFALITAPAHGQFTTPLTIKGVTLSNPTAAPGASVQATLDVANYTPAQTQGAVSLLWCDMSSVATLTPQANAVTRQTIKEVWTVSQRLTNCRQATRSPGTPLPWVGPKQSASVVVNNLVVPDACPAALVTKFGGSSTSDVNNRTVAFPTPVYPTRAEGPTALNVQSIVVQPDVQGTRRNVTVAYTLTAKTPPKFDTSSAIVVEMCRAEKCHVKAKLPAPSPMNFKLTKEKVGDKQENRWVATGTHNASFALDNVGYFGGTPTEVRVFLGSRKIEEYHIVESRCEDPKAVFKQSFN